MACLLPGKWASAPGGSKSSSRGCSRLAPGTAGWCGCRGTIQYSGCSHNHVPCAVCHVPRAVCRVPILGLYGSNVDPPGNVCGPPFTAVTSSALLDCVPDTPPPPAPQMDSKVVRNYVDDAKTGIRYEDQDPVNDMVDATIAIEKTCTAYTSEFNYCLLKEI